MQKSIAAILALVAVVALIPISIIAASVVSVGPKLPQASITEPGADGKTRLVVVLLNPDCETTGGEYEATLRSAIAYRHYLSPDFEVACSPTLTWFGFDNIEKIFLPILRFFYPNDVFLFVFPEELKQEFNDYVFDNLGGNLSPTYIKLLLLKQDPIGGFAYIEKGMGFSYENPNSVRHEAYHLESCSIHPGGSDSEPETWVKVPNVEQYPWCS